MSENYILEYYQKINDGSITAGRWIHMLYARIIQDLEDKKYFFDQKKAAKAVEFMERFTHHSKGKWAPQRLKMELWQKAMISCIFGLVTEDGKRQYREVFMTAGRKVGKTVLCSGIAEKMAFASGEYGAEIYFVAPKLEQADIAFSDFCQSVEYEPELKKRIKRRRTDIYVPESNTIVKKLPFAQRRSDGYSVHLAICDELAAWPGDAGLKQYEVLASSMGSREEPILFSISTSSYNVDGSIYGELMKRSTSFLVGNSQESRLMPFLYIIDEVAKWNSVQELQKSIPNLGVSVSVDYILEEIAKAEGSLSKRNEFMVKYANVTQNSSVAWLSQADVEKTCGAGLSLEDVRHSYCVAGVDLSKCLDLTAACIVVEKDEKLHVFSQFFMPRNRIETAMAEDGVPYEIYRQQGLLTLSGDNAVDYHDVFNWFIGLIRTYEIIPLMIGYDAAMATYLVNELAAAKLRLDDVRQGFNLDPVIKEAESIIKDGKLSIGSNTLLKSHLLNASLKQDLESGKSKIVKTGTRTRIDGTAALLDALCVRQKWYAEIGPQLKNKKR